MIFNRIIENYSRYKGISSHDILKLLAIYLMIIDHIGKYIFPESPLFRLFGGLGFPIFFFLIGYSANFTIKLELILIAFSLLIFDILIKHSILPLNILFSILAAQFFMTATVYFGFFNKLEKKYLLFLILIIASFPSIFSFNYGSIAFLFMAAGYMVKHHPNIKRNLPFMVITFSIYMVYQLAMFNFTKNEIILLAVMLLYLASLMLRFDVKTSDLQKYPWLKNKIIVPLLYISRNSLYFYAAQLVIFKLINLSLFPEKYQSLRLLNF